MNDAILKIKEVSDGLLIQFKESGYCYFSTKFLVDSIGKDSNQIFVDHDECVHPTHEAADANVPFLLTDSPVFGDAIAV